METINAFNVNDALAHGLAALRRTGVSEPSRNGPVLALPHPVMFAYAHPDERVMFSAARNANPFFHLFEALWMLAGRNDVAFPAYYSQQLQLYSDDSTTLNGAYGHRWRAHFGYDQLALIVEELRVNPASRRCVLAMWDGMDEQLTTGSPGAYEGDLKRALAGGKDVPCNTHVYFRIVGGQLDMTVCNRSNDAVWGAQGANAVHFSILQEYVASAVGVPLGIYYQFANNYHVYTEREDVQRLMKEYSHDNRYDAPRERFVTKTPLMTSPGTWEAELTQFLSGAQDGAKLGPPYENFVFVVADIMARAHRLYKVDDLVGALKVLGDSRIDWLVAAREWLERIAAARALKAGVAA